MSKRRLEIRFSRERRVNDHVIDKYSLYSNGKEIYSAQYKSCVIEYINEKFATKTHNRLKKKLSKLAEVNRRLEEKIYLVQKTMNKPLVKVKVKENDMEMNKYIVELTHYEGDGRAVPFDDLSKAADFTFSFIGGCVLAELFEESVDGVRSLVSADVLDKLKLEYDRKEAIKRLDSKIESSERNLKILIQTREELRRND